ncbi:MAG TPA: DedA family protein [Verrucomicrobiae bacterium]|nr:DedA family protein [Verrucomicrobiae bacterium]
MLQAIGDWVAELYSGLGYLEIAFLMALESSLFPVPSELVMIPAGYRAATGALDPVLCVLFGTLGSVVGASANYLLGQYVGKALLLKYGKYFLIDNDKYHEAEAMFLKNAYMATFIGRLLPVVRHLISLPAGVFGMKWLPFIGITAAGAAIWCSVLVAAGYYFGEPAVAIARDYMHELAIAVAIALVAFAAWFVFHKARRRSAS